jgi:HK97 family phage portal protein
MPTIQTAGQLAQLDASDPLASWSGSRPGRGLALYPNRRAGYASIVRSQPNVRTVISFIARNVAQLGVQLFERQSDTNRERVREHPFAEAIRRPNPADRRLTTYRLMHRTVWDACAYDVAFWAILPAAQTGRSVIVPLRPDRLVVKGNLWPTGYEYHARGGVWELRPDQVAYFQVSWNLDDPNMGVSPIETLRRTIAEDDAAGRQREQFWRSGARVSGVIERPADAPDWTDPARERFKADWDGLYSGEGAGAGGTPILEDGMTFQEAGSTTDARGAQYVEARKLSREEAAAAYHVDPIWVGIAGAGLSFSSVVERHKALYQDTLGPWVVMLEQDLTFQALPNFEEDPGRLDRLYVKLNIAEKLRGSVEDMADSLTKLTGRPVLEVNEARALIDRNDIDGGDGLAVPLNLTVVGEAPAAELAPGTDEPTEDEPPALASSSRPALARGRKAAGLTQDQHEALKAEHVAEHRQILERTFGRQLAEVLAELGDLELPTADQVWDGPRWNAELETDLLGAALDLAGAYAPAVAEALAADPDDLDLDELIPWLAESSRIAAENINVTTRNALEDALGDEEPLEAVRTLFANAESSRAETSAVSRFTAVAAFTAQDTAQRVGRSSKVWVVTSSNSRHPGLDGETVPFGEAFSNGLQYPGDPAGSADETAHCTCLLDFE